MDVRFWAATDVGRRRDHNEDNFLVDSDLDLFVVCDGMGGHAAGEVASAMSVQVVHEVVREHLDVLEEFDGAPLDPATRRRVCSVLENAVEAASMRIYRAAEHDPERSGMGTTCIAFLVRGERGFVGHVGDSRLYRMRDGVVEQLSEDHSLLNEMIRQGKAKAGDQIPNKNAVTRAVGVRDSVEVDTFDFGLKVGDRFLLCSDGLTEYIDHEEQLADLLEGDNLEVIADACITHANDGGGKDNITTVLVDTLEGDSQGTRLDGRVVDAIGDCGYFEYATTSEVVMLARAANIVALAAGDSLVEAGDPSAGLCLVVRGTVGALVDGETMAVLGAGETFGSTSIFEQLTSPATYEALEESEVVCLDRDKLFEVLRDRPSLAAKTMWALASDFAARLHDMPAGLQFDPQRWEDVDIDIDEEDATPPPGCLVIKDKKAGDSEVVDDEADDEQHEERSGFEGEPTLNIKSDDEQIDLKSLRTTIQLDLEDDDIFDFEDEDIEEL